MTGLLQQTAENPELAAVRLLRPALDQHSLRVLLLHGLASSGTVWQDLDREAAPDCALWTAELPWRADGSTAWAQHPDVGAYAARALNAVPGGADVVIAHSFAATVLLDHLGQVGTQGTAIRGIVLVSPFYRDHAEDFDWATISYYLNDFARILAEGIRIRAGGRLDPDRQYDMALRVQDRIGPYGWVRFFETYLRTPQLRLDRIVVPCLIISGAQDIAASPADARALASALPFARARVHIIQDCGHFPMTERAEAFGALVNDFLVSVNEHRSPTR